MARQKVLDLDTDKIVKFEKRGQSFKGYYLGTRRVNTGMSESSLHVFSCEGENVGMWGSAKLDRLIGSVPKGHMTFVTFQGKRKIGGGKTLKMFDLEFDDQNRLTDVVDTSDNSTESSEASVGSFEGSSGDSSEEYAEVSLDEVDDLISNGN